MGKVEDEEIEKLTWNLGWIGEGGIQEEEYKNHVGTSEQSFFLNIVRQP